MYLELYERRTNESLVPSRGMCEDNCVFCEAKNNVNPLGSLVANIHNQKDDRGIVMMEQPVTCLKCGKEWVDVFQRVYPDASRSDRCDNPGGMTEIGGCPI